MPQATAKKGNPTHTLRPDFQCLNFSGTQLLVKHFWESEDTVAWNEQVCPSLGSLLNLVLVGLGYGNPGSGAYSKSWTLSFANDYCLPNTLHSFKSFKSRRQLLTSRLTVSQTGMTKELKSIISSKNMGLKLSLLNSSLRVTLRLFFFKSNLLVKSMAQRRRNATEISRPEIKSLLPGVPHQQTET